MGVEFIDLFEEKGVLNDPHICRVTRVPRCLQIGVIGVGRSSVYSSL